MNRFKGFGFWNERMLVYDSPVDTSMAAIGFVETYAMNSADMRSVIKRFPSGYKVTRHLVIVRLWRMAFSSESLQFAIRRIKRQREKTERKRVLQERQARGKMAATTTTDAELDRAIGATSVVE